MHVLAEPPQMGSRHLSQRQPAQVGIAQIKDLRAQREERTVGADVAEIEESVQAPAGRGPVDAGRPSHLTQRELRVVGAEHSDDGQPTI